MIALKESFTVDTAGATHRHWRTVAVTRTAWVAALVCGLLVVAVSACGQAAAGKPLRSQTRFGTGPPSLRVLSWNVSSDAFLRDPAAFRSLVLEARADILLLDEVAPEASESQIRSALAGPGVEGDVDWHVDFGRSGGRQRGVIVSRMPLERLPEFSDPVPYPASERTRLHERMVAAEELRPAYTMDGGIPVNGVVVLAGERRLLVVTLDLQCCGNDPASWQEDRRQVETRELRRRIQHVLQRTRVDGIIVAGDFNLVGGALPMVILCGPYRPPHAGLIAAELRHLDGLDTWTWDGRSTPFASTAMDFMLYSPQALELREGYVLDTEDLSSVELQRLGLRPETSARLSDHRPLVAEFVWQ